MSDPLSRLQFARDEIDRVFGANYAAAHPEVVTAVMATAASDFAALAVAAALRDIAAALADEPAGVMIRAPGSLVR